MQGMKMADALVGATIKVALEKVVSVATDQIGMVWGFEEDLERLRKTVEMILAVVDDAEETQVKDQVKYPAVNLWLKNLEELACRAEHVLDEVNYEILRHTMEDKNRLWGKVRFSSSPNIGFRWKMARKFENMSNEFELINKQASALGLPFRVGAGTTLLPTNTEPFREKDSVVCEKKVIGREKDASKIVKKLLSPSNELLSFISITGMGGLGKTTLAQLVYNNEQVVKHFGKKIWVCVSEDFEPKRIFKLILESLTKNDVASLEGKDTIVQKIKEKLEGERYLLILDDVWNENSELWGDFLCSLDGISANSGNWIIVTTRKLQVASNLPAECRFSLGKLSDEDCLHIVKEKAFLRGEGIQEFEATRERIRELCQGLPLAASVIGGLLRTKQRDEWLSILQRGISNISGDECSSHIMQILKLSFDHLPSPSIKKCFAYCSLFEKDSLMEKKQLVQLWMAEGFLQQKFGDEMEIGKQYIKSLLQSSLLQEVIDKDGKSRCVRMHDLVHDLAKLISKSKSDVRDVKHQDRYLVADSFGEETKTLPKMRMLRTLFLRSGIPDGMLMSFRHLHVLKLSKVRELPSSIGKLIHLRYLEVSGSVINALPESLCKLYNLQTLRINRCRVREAFPKGMTTLISLRHLHCDPRHRMPSDMGRLTSLQTLEHFRISQENQIKELGCLENLRGNLAIYHLERVSSKEEALQARLYKKPMKSLKFCWSREVENGEGVLDGLQSHPNLQELTIDFFSGSQFPSWLSIGLDKLVSLSIRSCKRCQKLPALGQLPSLMYLKLRALDNIRCIELSFYGIDDRRGIANDGVPKKIFPSLSRLVVERMKNLEEWMEPQTTDGQAVEMFPNLEEFTVEHCPQLSSAPIHYFRSLKHLNISFTGLDRGILPSVENSSRSHPNSAHVQKNVPTFLRSLEIFNCDSLSELPECLYEFKFLRILEISDCPNLKSLPIPSGQQHLTSLQKLSISKCDKLRSIPADLLKSCISLHSLTISDCKELRRIHGDLLKSCTSLQTLTISDCKELRRIHADLLKSCTSLHTLTISDCKELRRIPDLLESCASLQSLSIYRLRNLDSFPCDLQQMPSLSSLVLFDVPKLITVPKELASCCSRLYSLSIGGFPDSVEFDWAALSSSSYLRRLVLLSWPHLVSLPDQLQHLTGLRELRLFQLGQIEALPDWFANLVSLEKLYLYDCKMLGYLPSMEAMRSLTKLSVVEINRCPLLEKRCTQRTGPGSEWVKISQIPYTGINNRRVRRVESRST